MRRHLQLSSAGIHDSMVYGKESMSAQMPRMAACSLRSARAYVGAVRAGTAAWRTSLTKRSLSVMTLCRGETRRMPERVLIEGFEDTTMTSNKLKLTSLPFRGPQCFHRRGIY